MSTQLATVPRSESPEVSYPKNFWVMPDDMQEGLAIAKVIAESTLCPKAFKEKPGDVYVAAKFGQEVGLSIMQSIQGIAVINGHPGLYGDTMLAVIMAHPAYESHEEFFEGTGDTLKAVHIIKRRGQQPHRSEFSIEDAKRADLWDDRAKIDAKDPRDPQIPNTSPWYCYPKRMLMFRARGFALRDRFADALRGMKSAEELGDYPKTIDATFESREAQRSTGDLPKEDPQITPAQVAGLGDLLKKAGYVGQEGRAEVRAYLTEHFKCETTTQIKASQHAAVLEWAKKPRVQSGTAQTTPNQAPDPKASAKAEANKSEDLPQSPPRLNEIMSLLGWNSTTRSNWLKANSNLTGEQQIAKLEPELDK